MRPSSSQTRQMPVSRASWPLKMASDQGSVNVRASRAATASRSVNCIGRTTRSWRSCVGDDLEAHDAPPARRRLRAGSRGVASGARP